MINVLVRITVEDLAKWKPVFEKASAIRKSYGAKGSHAFSREGSPNEIFILTKFEDMEQAKKMYQSQELRDAMNEAGVKGPPELTFLNEVIELPA